MFFFEKSKNKPIERWWSEYQLTENGANKLEERYPGICAIYEDLEGEEKVIAEW